MIELWEFLRINISLNLPNIALDSTSIEYIPNIDDMKREENLDKLVTNDLIKYLNFTEDNIDHILHISVKRVIEKFPFLKELSLSWY
mmetsp:Transcript_31590/g.27984  ORF Transcript_31590/g.27984 Transcript_31590/m.27984 type:complete len:87 (+) Transcript_31590:650-910(+)